MSKNVSRAPTILLVDDADLVRKSAARWLRYKGYVVLEAAAADQALALLDANLDRVDMILTDLRLPAMDGAALVQEARRRAPSVGFAYMTGHLPMSARECVLDESAPVLLKPFTPSLLEEGVRAALAAAGWQPVVLPTADAHARQPRSSNSLR